MKGVHVLQRTFRLYTVCSYTGIQDSMKHASYGNLVKQSLKYVKLYFEKQYCGYGQNSEQTGCKKKCFYDLLDHLAAWSRSNH